MVTMCKLQLSLILLIIFCATASIYATHFRGGVIMVRPKIGGANRKVSQPYITVITLVSYNSTLLYYTYNVMHEGMHSYII